MTLTDEQRHLLAAAGWTEQDQTTFTQKLASFRDGLGAREREAFDAILTLAHHGAQEDDVQGYLVVIAIIAVLIGPLVPEYDPKKYTPPPSKP